METSVKLPSNNERHDTEDDQRQTQPRNCTRECRAIRKSVATKLWRRNDLRPSIRFQSPLIMNLYFDGRSVEFHQEEEKQSQKELFKEDKQEQRLKLLLNPVQRQQQEVLNIPMHDEEYMEFKVIQRLETVNSLWDASIVMCGYFMDHFPKILKEIVDWKKQENRIDSSVQEEREQQPFSIKIRILELGAGCGTTSIVAHHLTHRLATKRCTAALNTSIIEERIDNLKDLEECLDEIKTEFIVTELEEEMDLLHANVNANPTPTPPSPTNSEIIPQVLYWGSTQHESVILDKFEPIDLLLATDIIYEIQHFDLLLQTLSKLIPLHHRHAYLLMAMEHRWSDIEKVWWDLLTEQGFKFHVLSIPNDVWYFVDKIDIYKIYRHSP